MNVCHWCEAAFRNVQALRGHLRWCAPYRVSKNVMPIDRQGSSKLISGETHSRTQRQRLLIIHVHHLLRQLTDLCVQHTKLAKLLNSVYHQEEMWRSLLLGINQQMEYSWNMVNGLGPAPHPIELFDAICSLQSTWMTYRTQHVCQTGETGDLHGGPHEESVDDATTEESGMFGQLVVYLKELIAIMPP